MPGLFGGFVAINQLPKDDESFAVYILTRPFDLTSVKPRHSHKIYTTTNLKWAMICNEKPNIMDNITAISDNRISYGIDLPNDKTLLLRSYTLNTFTLKVMLHFEYENVHSLYYDGPVTDPKKILDTPELWDRIKSNGIDQLLLDTTSIHIHEFKMIETACKEIIKFFESHEDFQVNLILEEFGYEDLLVELVNRGLKICLDTYRCKIFKRSSSKIPTFCDNQPGANIFVSNKMPTKTLIHSRFKDDKIATMAFRMGLEFEAVIMASKKGLFYIKYTPNQTFPDAHFLAEIIAPKEILPIQSDNTIPSSLKDICRH